ncbi:hypothetical protein IEQ34_011627 [Dendrobium chrysotoxum]|uniref:DNA-directed RNA polymerase III subunit RPC5 n=1 Tax=Dendrobium chrysotoxum TaxID=161865 RepID=A0AAV7GSR3_DENCH|nr:hypothetical protein IEQ34_011627 [Dendrobium chrysotoxum]
MGAGDELFDDSSMDIDVVLGPPKPSRFGPKIKGKGKVKAEPSLTPYPAPPAAESIPYSDKMEPSEDLPVPHSNGVNAAAVKAESNSMDVEEEEDAVVREFDVYINPCLDADTKLYDMRYPLRPSWRPYEMNERCAKVRIKPKLAQFEIQLSLDIDSENYNKEVDHNLKITTQTLSSSSKPSVNDYAVGFLRGNSLHVIPLHAVVQFRSSIAHLNGVQKVNQGGHQPESNLKPVGNFNESPKLSNNKGKAVKDDAKEANEHINVDEPWVLLQYHASDSPVSCIYREQALKGGRNYIPLAMKSSDYLDCCGSATFGSTRKTTGPSKRYLLTRPLEERLKQWLSEGPQVNRFVALLHLAPNDSVEDVLKLLQHHAYLVQGLWVSKSSLLHDGLPALYRDYILLQFSKKHAVHESILKLVKPEDLRKGLLKPLAVERSLLKDWKFKEDTDLSFIKQYPEIVKEQEYAWSVREKKILESLHGSGRNISSLLKNSVSPSTSSTTNGSIELGHHRDRNDGQSSVVSTMPTKGQEALEKAILELLRTYKVLSLNSIIQGLQGNANAGLPEVENVADQIAMKVHDVYVLKSLGKPTLDKFRHVVIEYLIGKGRNAKVKKQEIKLAAQLRLKKDVSDAEYSMVMNELCMSSGGSWMLKSGALR